MKRWVVLNVALGREDVVIAHDMELDQGALVFFRRDPGARGPIVHQAYAAGAWATVVEAPAQKEGED